MKYFTLALIFAAILTILCVGCAIAAESNAGKASAQTAVSGCGGGCGSAYGTSSTGGCGASGGCETLVAKTRPSDPLQLTATQKKQLAAIDKKYGPTVSKLSRESYALLAHYQKLYDDPRADVKKPGRIGHRLGYLEAEMEMSDRAVSMARARIYAARQKTILANTSDDSGGEATATSSGRGSSSGGCGAPSTSSPATAAK